METRRQTKSRRQNGGAGRLKSSTCARRDNCRLCGSTNLTSLFSLAPTPPANAFVCCDQVGLPQPCFPLDVYMCESCKHVQLLDVVNPSILFTNYIYVSGTSPVFVKHFENYATSVIREFVPNHSDQLVIDIGSNDGTLLSQFKRKGMRVLGIDPAKEIARNASKAGIETWPEFFTPALAEKIVAHYGHAQIVAANNVFAHADDLTGIASGIRTLLAPDGVFVFEVSYLADVFEKILFDTIYHEHLAYHCVKPLVNFFAAQGMQLIATKRTATHGGSLRGIVQLAGGPLKVETSVDSLLKLERSMGLDKLETLRAFGSKIDRVKHELTSYLHSLKTQGKSIAGFGAPAKATTLMYHFSIGPDIIDFIVDDSPFKQGLYSPGKHIPVLEPAAIYEKKPDAIIILAWNFAESIMKNHAAFLKMGGEFIVPLPNVKILKK